MEQVIFYILIFCIGTLFGSFFTLAVYRIPLHQDITHKRSYCPNCNHKLSFWDMIPILSYIMLGGKCRYCKEKIRIRYLFLEIITGITFLLFGLSLNFNFMNVNISKIIYFIFGILYIAGIIIIAGIDKENRKIHKSVLFYELIIIFTYMIYLYIVEKANIYRYVIYLFSIIIILILDNLYLKKKLKSYYPIEVLELAIIIVMFCNSEIFVLTAILTLLTIAIKKIIIYIIDKKNNKKSFYKDMPLGFYICLSNIIIIIISNFIACRG